MSPKGINRKRRGIAKLGVAGATVAASAIFAAPASAVLSVPEIPGLGGLNPQTTNVPTIVWKGQEAKLVACSPFITGDGQEVEFRTKKWSGSEIEHVLVPESQGFTTPSGDVLSGGCVKATFDSLESGLAMIHMSVKQNGTNVVDHDFLAGWMDMNAPTLAKVDDPGDGNNTYDSGVNSHADFADSPEAQRSLVGPSLAGPFGDDDVVAEHPTTVGGRSIIAGENNARMTSDVTGSIPIRSGFVSGDKLGSRVDLPTDWAKLASVLATDQNSTVSGLARQLRWDIHDDRANRNDTCAPATPETVQNCVSTFSVGSGFSRKAPSLSGHLGEYGSLPIGLTMGPFDGLFADNTLLNDGKIDAGDAPMPPARIDYDLSGIGSLDEASKPDAYSKDGEAGYLTDEVKGNLYAPFYATIPSATIRSIVGDQASGNASAIFTNNFPGLGSLPGVDRLQNAPFNTDLIYPYWFHSKVSGPIGGDNGCQENYGDSYQKPSGPNDVSLINDESGETQTEFNPGLGFNAPAAGQLPTNRNGGCDLQNVDVLGESTITATAKAPYHQSGDDDLTSNPVTYQVKSLWDRSLSAQGKGQGSENGVARIVVAHAQNIDGTPFAGETVCWMGDKDAEGMRLFSGNLSPNGIGTKEKAEDPVLNKDGSLFVDSDPAADPFSGLHRLCGTTDENGNTAVEVFNSNGGTVNMIAEYANAGILRHMFVDYGAKNPDEQGPQGPAGPQGPSGPTGSKGDTGTTPPTNTVIREVVAAQNAKSDAAPVSAASLQVSSAKPSGSASHTVSGRLVRSAKGSHVRVIARGAAGKVRLRIALQTSKGKTVKTLNVTVDANKRVTVKTGKIARSVRKAAVSVA